MNKKEDTINGMPATPEQVNQVLYLQEKKRRIQAEARLLVHEEREVDAALEAIVREISDAQGSNAAEDNPSVAKEGAA